MSLTRQLSPGQTPQVYRGGNTQRKKREKSAGCIRPKEEPVYTSHHLHHHHHWLQEPLRVLSAPLVPDMRLEHCADYTQDTGGECNILLSVFYGHDVANISLVKFPPGLIQRPQENGSRDEAKTRGKQSRGSGGPRVRGRYPEMLLSSIASA
ncbi:uncharacterized protein BJX67DRAFT_63367 [Aspergillus lucknowensis]|uniref:Uncharacterized protein n=1 Tax=Aspergillus lucknowensis TaxID=176173 RepID=A0ABR4LUK8_9EURO